MAKKWIGKAMLGCAAAMALASSGHAAPVQWTAASGGNDHWYEFVDAGVSWQTARAAANAASFMGMQGYLATVTSEQENRFVLSGVAQGALAWLGGSDEAVEGDWRWMDGPEAGQLFGYTNWNPGEPNNFANGEDYLHGNWGPLTWNDHGLPSFANQFNGYVIEYGGGDQRVPVPGTLALLAPALLGLTALRRRKTG